MEPRADAAPAPRRTRRAGRARLLAVAVVALVLAVACETSSQDRSQVQDLVNGARSAASVPTVVGQGDVDAEADRWARAMRDACTLGHRPDITANIPDGWTLIGENVGVSSQLPDESDAAVLQRLHDALMASPGHRANILGPSFDQVGIGAVKGDCPNVGGDDPEYWIVEIFVGVD